MNSLSLASLPPLSPDKSNRIADDPRAVELGHSLFFDQRFSGDGTVSCASCHMPELNFQDARAHGRGMAETRRRTQSIVGSAYFAWFFWDGSKDSQWSQALSPLEHDNEHGGDRAQYAHLLAENYRDQYEDLFGALPDLQNIPPHAGPLGDDASRAAWDGLTIADQKNLSQLYANMGKAIAAYERKILPGASRFDGYVAAVTRSDTQKANEVFSTEEIAGLKLFIGKADCVKCHNTPLFTDDEFHNTGVPQHAETEHDAGRAEGVIENFQDEFKCWSEHSDDLKRDCPQLRYMQAPRGLTRRRFQDPIPPQDPIRLTLYAQCVVHQPARNSRPLQSRPRRHARNHRIAPAESDHGRALAAGGILKNAHRARQRAARALARPVRGPIKIPHQ